MATMLAIPSPELCVNVPPTAFTVAGFRSWMASGGFPEHGRVDLCGGEVSVDMSPERAESHTLVKCEVHRVLAGIVRERDLGRIYGDGVTYTSEEAAFVTQPDGLFFGWDALLAGRVRGGREGDDPFGVAGAVDWVLEVVSPSSVQKDRRTLLEAYARAGVREYRVVDARGDDVVLDVFTARPEGLRPVAAVDGWSASEIFEARFRLARPLSAAAPTPRTAARTRRGSSRRRPPCRRPTAPTR